MVVAVFGAVVASLFAYALDLDFLRTYAFVVGTWIGFQLIVPAKYRT